MNRIKTLYNGADIGYCRICGTKTQLSRDHIPPHSMSNNKPVIISNAKNYVVSQNGMKFKTICMKCNNELLGKIDNEQKLLMDRFSKFTNDIRVYRSPFIGINVNTYRLMRSVLGHYLGICFGDNVKEIISSPIKNSRFYEEIRQFVLGRVFSLDITRIYYWYYPYDDIRICQFEAYIPNFSQGNRAPIFGGLIKYYPIAYWIVNGEATTVVPNLQRMKIADKDVILKIKANTRYAKLLIESPGKDDAILMSGDGRIEANKRE